MKRIILLAALIVAAAASACKTAEAPSNTNATPQPANTSAAATPKAEATTTDSAVVTQEKQIWDNIKKKDSEAFAAMLAEDFVYVSGDGVYDKAGTVSGLKQIEATDITLSDWKTVMLNKDAALVTYTVEMKGTSGGNPMPSGAQRAGSLWVNRAGKWIGVFHQDTAVEAPPPMSGDSSKEASDKAATKPTAQGTEPKAAEPVSDDPVVREKQIWDALKKKDYDRFASYLAEDQIEVFGWGVNDKAGSVEGVKHADLSRAILSDFRTAKISDDVSIVTYMIKGGGDIPPSGSRASTVWGKRDGKWMAIYHQDTTVTPAMPKK